MARTMTLPDGRALTYDVYGDPEGAPVIFSHGFSDSHVIRHPDDSLTASLGFAGSPPPSPASEGRPR
jgi:pimeloyl-ACP methyl ester carboxylesterase